jgi:hypothetical protein
MDLNETSGIAREIELAKLTVLLHRTDAFTVTEPTRLHDKVGPTRSDSAWSVG